MAQVEFNGGVDQTRISVRPENPHSAIATMLITELVDELTRRYADRGDDEASSFNPADATVPRSIFLIATLDGEPAGCGALRPFSETVVEIKRMYVREPARGHGIGRRLLAELERIAAEFNYETMILETGVRQPEAIALYTGRGFTRIDPYADYKDNPLSVCFQQLLGGPARP
jgi:GNAT superfamily N-acetyltransferase